MTSQKLANSYENTKTRYINKYNKNLIFYFMFDVKMTKQERNYRAKAQSIAYWSGCNGLEVKKIDYGIVDRVIFAINCWNNTANMKVKSAIIHYTNKGAYFTSNGYKVPLDELISM